MHLFLASLLMSIQVKQCKSYLLQWQVALVFQPPGLHPSKSFSSLFYSNSRTTNSCATGSSSLEHNHLRGKLVTRHSWPANPHAASNIYIKGIKANTLLHTNTRNCYSCTKLAGDKPKPTKSHWCGLCLVQHTQQSRNVWRNKEFPIVQTIKHPEKHLSVHKGDPTTYHLDIVLDSLFSLGTWPEFKAEVRSKRTEREFTS